MTFRKLLVLSAILVVPIVATASAADSAWALRKWQTGDGLPNNTVTGLAQTPDGFLWIATPGSFARFDGTQFELLTLSKIIPDYHQNARVLLTAHDGSLWIATAHGPVVHIKADNDTEIFSNNLPDLVVRRLIEDGDGGIWLVFSSGQLRRIKDGQVQSFSEANGLPAKDYVLSLTCDKNGVIWFTRGGYVGKFQNGQFRPLAELGGMSQMQLAGARDGGVWICTGSKLFKCADNGEVHEIGPFQNYRPNCEPTQIFEDRDGGVWIGTSDSGLFHYSAAGFEQVETSHPEISCLMQDNEGNIWAGTSGGGLDRIRPCVVKLEDTSDGLPFESVESICEDATGTLWAVTQNGLLVHNIENKWNLVSTNSGWQGQEASCVTVDKNGAVWVGAKNELYFLRDGQWKKLGHTDGLLAMRIATLFPAANGDLWVAGTAPESLQRWRDGQWKNFSIPQSGGYIRALAQDTAGNIWAGTTRGILFRIRGDEVSDVTTNVFDTFTSVRSICITDDGDVWFASAGGGLIWMNRDGHTGRITTEQGLPDNYLSQIIADGNGYLWFGSDHGIFKAREQSLEAVAEGKSSNIQCIQYGRNVGLSGLQANFSRWPSTARSRDGYLWMPMSTGLAKINPNNGDENSHAPPVLIKRVVMDDEIVADYGNIVPAQSPVNLSRTPVSLQLPPKHSRLEFDWTALDFSAPEDVNFRYQLSGLDAHWIDGGIEHRASYSRLSAGKYVFKVEARNGDGEWRESPALVISVTPFFWQTWWFRCIAVLIFTLAVIRIVRYASFRRLQNRLRLLEQQAALERERLRIARDIHDDLGGRLTELELSIELAKRTPPEKLNGQMQKIATTVRQVGQSLDEIVWSANPRHDSLSHLMDYLSQFAIEFSQTAGIRCRVDFPDEFPQQTMPPEARHNLFLTVKEALNNVARHAGATEIWLRASFTENSLAIVIEDNGKGFDGATEKFCADGLGNMRQRMEETGGEFKIESRPNSGTRIFLKLSFPLKIKSPATSVI